MTQEQFDKLIEDMECQLNNWKMLPIEALFTEARFYDLMCVYSTIIQVFKALREK